MGWLEGSRKIQVSTMDVEYNMINIIKTGVLYTYNIIYIYINIYIKVVNGANPESSNHKENTFFYFFNFVSIWGDGLATKFIAEIILWYI